MGGWGGRCAGDGSGAGGVLARAAGAGPTTRQTRPPDGAVRLRGTGDRSRPRGPPPYDGESWFVQPLHGIGTNLLAARTRSVDRHRACGGAKGGGGTSSAAWTDAGRRHGPRPPRPYFTLVTLTIGAERRGFARSCRLVFPPPVTPDAGSRTTATLSTTDQRATRPDDRLPKRDRPRATPAHPAPGDLTIVRLAVRATRRPPHDRRRAQLRDRYLRKGPGHLRGHHRLRDVPDSHASPWSSSRPPGQAPHADSRRHRRRGGQALARWYLISRWTDASPITHPSRPRPVQRRVRPGTTTRLDGLTNAPTTGTVVLCGTLRSSRLFEGPRHLLVGGGSAEEPRPDEFENVRPRPPEAADSREPGVHPRRCAHEGRPSAFTEILDSVCDAAIYPRQRLAATCRCHGGDALGVRPSTGRPARGGPTT